MDSVSTIVQKQRTYFLSGITRDIKFRKAQLKKFREAVVHFMPEIEKVLHADLGKTAQESYMTEIGSVLHESRSMRKNISEWARPQSVPGMVFSFPSSGKVYAEPRGVTLIISPWNYPFWLSMMPVIGAIGAGNCVIIKPSELSPNTSVMMKKMIDETFPAEYITVVEGGVEASTQLLAEKFDYIFFTGGARVGKIVAAAAAQNITPYTLELGGKSPCIIDENVNMKLAAKRIAWGKWTNSGQTCVAPDYVLAHKNISQKFIAELKSVTEKFYPKGAMQDENYPHLIGKNHFNRVKKMMEGSKVAWGGSSDASTLKIEPTVLNPVTWNDAVMQDEIFGPLLPVIEFETVNEVLQTVNAHPKPLMQYIFSNNKNFCNRIVSETSFGAGMINDTIEHLGNSALPFGGVGDSGMGSYHGKFSFDTFTHYKGVMKKATWLDMPFRYLPEKNWKKKVTQLFLR